MENHIAFPKPVSAKKLIVRRISPIGKRTKERISLHGSESYLHDSVWNIKEHRCEVCKKYIHNNERSPICFAHRLWKGMYKKYRYMEENIALVCSVHCHHELDKLYQWNSEEQVRNRNGLKSMLENILGLESGRIKDTNGLKPDHIWIYEAI